MCIRDSKSIFHPWGTNTPKLISINTVLSDNYPKVVIKVHVLETRSFESQHARTLESTFGKPLTANEVQVAVRVFRPVSPIIGNLPEFSLGGVAVSNNLGGKVGS